MGPGIVIKAIGGHHFSLVAFAIAQVALDIEPLIALLRRADAIHGRTHTYVRATVIGLLVTILAPTICRPVLEWWNRKLYQHEAAWLQSLSDAGWLPAATGALLGTYSHVAVDSILYWEMAPFYPWFTANEFLRGMSHCAVYLACVGAGLLGLAAWLLRCLLQKGGQRRC